MLIEITLQQLNDSTACYSPGVICRDLDAFILHHNCLSVLPSSLYSLTALTTLDVSYNRLAHLQHEIGNMQSLQVKEPNRSS